VTAPALLALRPLGLGDFLTGIPAYRALARAFPDHHRIFAGPRYLHELVPLTRSFTTAIDVQPLQPLTPFPRLGIAVDLHGKGPESHRVLFAARPARFIGFSHADVPESHDGATWRADEHEISRWARMLCEAGVPCDAGDLEIDVPACDGVERFADAVVVHAGAASEARRWPLERFAAVVRAVRARGVRVVVSGGTQDVARARELVRLAGLSATDLAAGTTSLLSLATLVGRARGLICGDTGIAHLATATRTPSIVLFGPIAPSEWGPPPDRPRHRALWSGRHGSPHAAVVDRGLLDIGPDDVVAHLDAMLAWRANAAGSRSRGRRPSARARRSARQSGFH